MPITFIYALIDPETGISRYIGKSDDPERRYKAHLRAAKKPGRRSHCANWIKHLLDKGLTPKMRVIEKIDSSDWVKREKYWIECHRYIDDVLTNLTSGGEGVCKLTEERETARRQSIRLARTGMKFTEDHKEKLRLKKIKYYADPKNREKTSRRQARLTDEQIREIVACNLSQTKIGRMYGISQSIVSEIKSGKRYPFVSR